MRDYVLIYLNGQRHEIRGDKTRLMLSDYLRYELQLTGTKVVCAEGDCGACSVLRYFPNDNKTIRFDAINSCIATVAQMDGSHLVTIEGLATPELTNVQQKMVDCNGSQCGFCTPGFVIAMTALAERRLNAKKITEKEAKNYLTGNLCRCTGYQPIVDAAVSMEPKKHQPLEQRYHSKLIETELRKAQKQTLKIQAEHFQVYAPTTIKEAVDYLKKFKDARLIGAGTDLGVIVNKNKLIYSHLLSLHLINDLYDVQIKSSRVRVGARVTLAELRRAVESSIPEFARFLDLFASPQIKNVATLVGNLANASPIADTPPFLLVANAAVHVAGPKGLRTIDINDFYLGYKKIALKPGEFITHIEFDKVTDALYLSKSSQRKDLDISCVNAAFRLKVNNKKSVLTVHIAFGGVGPTPLRLKKTEAALAGKALSQETCIKALETLQSEISPLSDLRGTQAFRRVLAESLLENFLKEQGGL